MTTQDLTSFRPTILLYTQEKRGNQLVESAVIGCFSDFANINKFVVVRDPYTDIAFVYQIRYEAHNLDAVAITKLADHRFDGKSTTQIGGMTYKLGTPTTAFGLLKGRKQWVQDKGSVLSVLLHNAAATSSEFSTQKISRDRLRIIPDGTPIEYLARVG